MTILTVNLDGGAAGSLATKLGQQGVYAYAVYFVTTDTTPGATAPADPNNPQPGDLGLHYFTIVDGSTSTPVVNDTLAITLPDTYVSGKVYFIIQSVTAGNASGLFTSPDGGVTPAIITQESDINWNQSVTSDFRYDSFEVTLSSQAGDVGNLTEVAGFGIPIGVDVTYNGATPQTRGYKLDGATIFDQIATINPDMVTTFASGPLAGQNRMAASPATGGSLSPVLGPSSTDWLPYIDSLKGVTDIQITGYFNGAKSVETFVYNQTTYANYVYHNAGFYSYTMSYDTHAGVFVLKPAENSQIQGVIKITPDDLANSIYATNGTATIENPDGTVYTTMNTGANNEWGAFFVKFLVGFIGGYLGGTADQLNSELGTAQINLNKNWNYDPTFAFNGALTGQTVTPSSHVFYDQYAKIFFLNSNAYGNGYSDALMNALTSGGPLMAVANPNGSDVSGITLTIYDDVNPNAATGQNYTQAAINNVTAGPYVVSSSSGATSNLSLVLAFNVGSMTLASDVSASLGFWTSTTNGLASFNTVALDLAGAANQTLFQTWNWNGGSFTAAGAPAPTGAIINVNDLPYTTGINWYQLTVSNAHASQTWNLYFDAVAGQGVLNPYYSGGGQQNAIAMDGLASLAAGDAFNTAPQYLNSISVSLFNGGTISLDPALLTTITDSSLYAGNPGVWQSPNAPIVGTLDAANVFTQEAAGGAPTPTITTTGDLAFGWTGSDVNYIQQQAIAQNYVVQNYTNKVGALHVAHVYYTSIAGGAAPIASTVRSDLDGNWTTGIAQFGNGTYTAIMSEYRAYDHSFSTPMNLDSQSVTFTVALDTLSLGPTAGNNGLILTQGGSATTGNWIDLATTGSTFANGTLLAYATDSNGNMMTRDGLHITTSLEEAVLARIGVVKSDNGQTMLEGSHSLYLTAGLELHFAVETGSGAIDRTPTVTASGTGTSTVTVSDGNGSMGLTAVVNNTLDTGAALAGSQRMSDTAWVYLTQGSSVTVDTAWSSYYVNTVHFVRIDVDSATGGWSVGGVAYGNTDTFRAAVQANWDSFSQTHGNSSGTDTSSWTVSAGTGYYAPVMVNGLGDLFIINNGSASANTDGLSHVRNFGANTFGFEDAIAGDFDYNDMILKLTVT